MPKHELLFDVGEYAPVADRITLFYARFPMGRITTRLIARTEHEITVQAYVFRSVEEERPSATGLASERIGDGDVNTVACLENTETSAIGRALANLGLTASAQRPSREEMLKANRERALRVSEPSPRRLTSHSAPAGSVALQQNADRVMDALDLLAIAQRAGLTPCRARRLRETLMRPTVSDAAVHRVERLLRSWVAFRHALRLGL
ncbi:MAG TPA: hypothetical protein VIK41_17860 [Gemmatimonadaceae bacterium]